MSITDKLTDTGTQQETGTGFSPKRLNHAVLYVKDVIRSVEFYTKLMNMEVAATAPGMAAAFLRIKGSNNHHDLGLIGISGNDNNRMRSVGLYHLAWQVATIEELALAKTSLLKAGAYYGEANHGATLSIYGHDPDNIDFEIMWMLPRDAWGYYENQAVVENLDFAAALVTWAGVSTI